MYLTLFIAIISCTVLVSSKSESITGSLEQCSEEGQKIKVKGLVTKCYDCICKNGYVECPRKVCAELEFCYIREKDPVDSCCPKCKSCLHENVYHASGTEWKDPFDPCRIFMCKEGIITESRIACHTPCRDPIDPLPDQCCATCPGCKVNGQLLTKERTVMLSEDPCLKCSCDGHRLSCSKKVCPVLPCPEGQMDKRPGECCPHCIDYRQIFPPPHGFCLVGQHFLGPNNLKPLQHDRCTDCLCNNGTTFCNRQVCPILDCLVEQQIHKEGHCCPQCEHMHPMVGLNTDLRLAMVQTCSMNGQIYQDNETWQIDACKSCVCNQGKIRCAMAVCPPKMPCPDNSKRIHDPKECCSRCVENNGVCTVYGDPHYKTFDGKFYSFQGSCKYLLTSDCANNSFSIRVTNDPRTTKTSAWVKNVSVKMGSVRVNLGEKQRVKVNGLRKSVPFWFEKGVQLNISRENELLHVRTNIGVEIVWDGNSFLRVSVSPIYKGKTCGLCGNYNSVPRDDFTTKRGIVVVDAERFAASWKVGGKKACKRQFDPPSRTVQCNQAPFRSWRKNQLCKTLRNDVFLECHKKLNYNKYFKSCLLDMCECPTGNCYCQSFTAYAYECQKLGVELIDWRIKTNCFVSY